MERFINCNPAFFPNINKLSQILATLPLSTAIPERALSLLRSVKTYLRNSTGENRLNGLALMSVHRDIPLVPEDVVDQFSKECRCFIL
ncbi:hypothetical protein PR048_011298 [Dryococelus australis]|uniref:HAT C-terminal dimerisation domain-containing protein n=1 Tax=Dryococelus australis TaxID=614101 RepID=A0ABQ9HL88_9NEOP|nr:hypothetical protein PR048_011298 [Dryococelus australis]